MTTTDLQVAYLAGVIDADGYVTIHRHKKTTEKRAHYSACVGIAGTRSQPHDLAASIWGGKVGCFGSATRNARRQFQWKRYGPAALIVLTDIAPFLLVKRAQADLAILAQDAHDAGVITEDQWEQVWCRVVQLNEARHRLAATTVELLRIMESR